MTQDIATVLAHRRAQVDALGRLPALSFYAGTERIARRDWAALLDEVAACAAALARRGVRRGDAVAVLTPNAPETPALYLAVMTLGAVLVPLNPTAPIGDWAYAVRDAGAVGAVVAEPLLGTAASGLAPVSRFLGTPQQLAADGAGAGDAAPAGAGLADAPAVLLYTSGTTGHPKGVTLSHANLLHNARALARHFGLDGHAQLAVMPLYHAHAFGFGLMTALVSCGHLVLCDRLNPFAWAAVVRAEGVRVTSLVPPLLPLLTKLKVRAEQVPTLRCVLVSSAPLPVQTAREFMQSSGIPLVHGWGLSEFTNFATCTDAEAELRGALALLCDGALPCVGRPLPGVEVEVRNGRGLVQRPGAKGELFVRGASRMLGYHGAAEPPAADGWLATGDLGHFETDSAGPRYYISGRIKDVVIRDAEKVCPVTVEHRLLEACPELAGRLAVVGFEHCLHGEEIGAYVQAAGPEGLAEALAQRIVRTAHTLGNTLRPKVVLWGTEPVPATHTGKVQRALLKALFVPYQHYAGATQVLRADAGGSRERAA